MQEDQVCELIASATEILKLDMDIKAAAPDMATDKAWQRTVLLARQFLNARFEQAIDGDEV